MGPFDAVRLWLRFAIWAPLKRRAHPSFYWSHSQFGEDMVVRSLLEDVSRGFYVEVGAHHPVYFSNTYHFYRRGWRGINIDAAPGSMAPFTVLRPGDTNLEVCIGPTEGELVSFHVFDSPARNTFDESLAREIVASGTARQLAVHPMRTVSLTSCLERHGPRDGRIDLLSIDIEGLDEAVLASLDFARYRPRVIVFEDHDADLRTINDSPTAALLGRHGYSIVGKCGPSLIAEADRTR